MTSRNREGRRTFASDAALLAAGAILAAVLAYVLLLIITRGLGEDDAAPVVLIWSYWVLATAALGAPVQQWILHNSVVGVDRAAERAMLLRFSGLVVAVAGAVVVVSRLLDERVFHSSSSIFPVSLGLVTIGAWAIGIARGRLAAAGHYPALAASWPAENLVRVVAAAVVVAAGADARVLALVVPGGYVILAAYRLIPSGQGASGSAAASGGMLGSLAAISMISQALFAAVPFVVALADGAQAAVTGAFALLAVARIPNLVANATSLRILEWMTQLAQDRPGHVWPLRRRILAIVPPIAFAGAILAATLGRHLVSAVFGFDETLGSRPAALITFGALLAVGVLLLALSGVAAGRPVPVVLCGLVALSVGFCLALIPVSPVMRASVAFAAAEAAFFGGLAAVAVRERQTV